MSNKKRGKRSVPFARLDKELINSSAFQKISNASRVAYLLLKAQINSDKQTKVIFPYSEAQKYMDRHTFSRAIKQLSTYGFITIGQRGGLYRKTNVYTLIDAWRDRQL